VRSGICGVVSSKFERGACLSLSFNIDCGRNLSEGHAQTGVMVALNMRQNEAGARMWLTRLEM
jgi:hypothetical protein